MRYGMRHFAEIMFGLVGNFIVRSLHGQDHIGPGVAIGDRENVERIHYLLVRP